MCISAIGNARFEFGSSCSFPTMITIIPQASHIRDNHHHDVTPAAQISLTLSRHPSLSSIAPGRSSSCIGTELWYIGSSWSSCLCSSMWRDPQEYVTYEFVPTSPAVSCISSSSRLYSFRDGWYVTVHLLLCRVLPPGLVQYSSQHSCVVSVKYFLHTFT